MVQKKYTANKNLPQVNSNSIFYRYFFARETGKQTKFGVQMVDGGAKIKLYHSLRSVSFRCHYLFSSPSLMAQRSNPRSSDRFQHGIAPPMYDLFLAGFAIAFGDLFLAVSVRPAEQFDDPPTRLAGTFTQGCVEG